MSIGSPRDELSGSRQFVRYFANGIVATCLHYLALTFGVEVLHIRYAGIANLLAAVVGITASFTGSRYFVFDAREQPIARQFARFGLLYACIASFHTAILWGWTDVSGLDYRIGFVLAAIVQFVFSFWGNKHLVFR